MVLHTLGIDFHHTSDYYVNRPNGSGDNLLLIFKTPALITLNGEQLIADENTAVLYSKGYPQLYGACTEEYINHWVHFDIEQDDDFLRRVGLPADTLIRPADISSAEGILEQLSIESVSDSPNKAECTDLLLKLLSARLGGLSDSRRHTAHYPALKALRAEIYRNPSTAVSVNILAERLCISPSHFQYLYKTEFGISCMEDVITARIETAKHYLINTDLPVNRISELCGYENDVHFIRQFKKRIGLTALEYRSTR